MTFTGIRSVVDFRRRSQAGRRSQDRMDLTKFEFLIGDSDHLSLLTPIYSDD